MALIAKSVARLLSNKRNLTKAGLRYCATAIVSIGSPEPYGLPAIDSAPPEMFSSAMVSSDPPDLCYLIGLNGLLALDGKDYVDLDVFLGHHRFLSPIPPNRLFGWTFEPQKPYLIEDPVRRIIRSGALVPYAANKNEIALVNMFRTGNVGVHRKLGLLVFKSFRSDQVRRVYDPSLGYHEYSEFLKDKLSDHHGAAVLGALPYSLDSYFSDLNAESVNGDLIIDHPMTLPDEVFADTCVEAYRIVVQECPAVGDTQSAETILKAVGVNHLDSLQKILEHGLLPQFLPKRLQKKYPALAYPFDDPIKYPIIPLSDYDAGLLVFEVHRHGPIHVVEKQVVQVVQKNFPKFLGYHTRKDVLNVIRQAFPNYLSDAYTAFKNEGKWHMLRMRERHPIPSIYEAYTIPTSLVVAFISYCDCGRY